MSKALKVQDIFIYPIKSLAGIRLNEAEVEERGFKHDRRWMLVDQEGRFLTQRTHHQMALLQVEVNGEMIEVLDKNKPDDRIEFPADQMMESQILVEIWDDQVTANLVDLKLDSWFSQKLGLDCKLVMMPESTERKVSSKYAVNDESVSFADGMPYLIIGQESLNHLNSKLESPVPMNRFRPNIVFEGGDAYAEDSWKGIKIGELDFRVVKPCARCVLTTVDQDTAEKGKEPLKTLAGYRTINNKVMFGQNMVALQFLQVKVGDLISVE